MITIRSAFTLIELLVVVTIIVVLLALLSPALDKAIDQAQMTVCATKLRSIAAGMTAYAAEQKRFYPSRAWRRNAGARPNLIYDPGTVSPGAGISDERILFQQTVNLDAFMDPFVERIKIDAGSNRSDTYIYIPTNVYAGWRFAGQSGMIKIGDRFTSKDYDQGQSDQTHAFDIIAADMDQIRATDRVEVHSSHPDHTGTTVLVTYYNTNLVNTIPAFINAVPHTFSEWHATPPTWGRGPTDYNYARVDNSVFQLNDVLISPDGLRTGDERLETVSINYSNYPDHRHALPSLP